METRTPVTIVTGYLGSGKTTFLNHLLEQTKEKVAVIVNEFGDIGIDYQLIERTKEEIIEINSGCICCNVRKDLIDGLVMLSFSREQNMIEFDRIVIETTGLADPAPIVQTFLMDESMVEEYVIDSVCTFVDAKHISYHLDQKDEALIQIAFADVIVVNKTDIVTKEDLEKLITRLDGINPAASTHLSVNSQVDLYKVVNIFSYNLHEKFTLSTYSSDRGHHDEKVTSFSIQELRPLDLRKLNMWFSYLVQLQGENLYRYKGILNIDGLDRRFIFQGVHMIFAGEVKNNWGNEQRKSELVFIGKNLDKEKLTMQFRACIVK
ncbi:GTP-binding protein [Virgibacillus sp. Bac330]|uniref:CobW family GTP-binding protein n=1 Tax=Virgibacillus sp. Bac330 TaxID=2419841 RepID=UPI000EF4FB31|nr:GTP-binding protein [Virgibacillus sp. Bac330]